MHDDVGPDTLDWRKLASQLLIGISEFWPMYSPDLSFRELLRVIQ